MHAATITFAHLLPSSGPACPRPSRRRQSRRAKEFVRRKEDGGGGCGENAHRDYQYNDGSGRNRHNIMRPLTSSLRGSSSMLEAKNAAERAALSLECYARRFTRVCFCRRRLAPAPAPARRAAPAPALPAPLSAYECVNRRLAAGTAARAGRRALSLLHFKVSAKKLPAIDSRRLLRLGSSLSRRRLGGRASTER